MKTLLVLSITRAWALLAVATVVVFLLAENAAPVRLATIGILLIAAFKMRLVFLYFMELAGGARPWRVILEVWVAVVTLVIVGAYVLTPA